MVPGVNNIQAYPLSQQKSRSKNFLALLHVKLGIMKQFVNSLNKDGKCFRYVCIKLLGLTSGEQLKLELCHFFAEVTKFVTSYQSDSIKVRSNFLFSAFTAKNRYFINLSLNNEKID